MVVSKGAHLTKAKNISPFAVLIMFTCGTFGTIWGKGIVRFSGNFSTNKQFCFNKGVLYIIFAAKFRQW